MNEILRAGDDDKQDGAEATLKDATEAASTRMHNAAK